MLEDRAGKDPQFLNQNLAKFLAAARKRPELAGVYHHCPARGPAGLRRRGPTKSDRAGRTALGRVQDACRRSWAECW